MKQTLHNKGSTVDQHGVDKEQARLQDFYEHPPTGLQRFPVPERKPIDLARILESDRQTAYQFVSGSYSKGAFAECRWIESNRESKAEVAMAR